MKIVHTVQAFKHYGGMQYTIAKLCKFLHNDGHECHIVTEKGVARSLCSYALFHEVNVIKILGYRYPINYSNVLSSVISKDSILHVHGQRVWSTDFLPLKYAKNMVFMPHGLYEYDMKPNSLINKFYYPIWFMRFVKASKYTIMRNPRDKNLVIKWGANPEKVLIIPAEIDIEEFERCPWRVKEVKEKYSLPDEYVLYVGGLYENKRVDFLIRALEGINVPLVVIGKDLENSKYNLKYCKELAKKLGVKLIYLGMVPREDLINIYRGATIFLLGSQHEGFGIVLLEAMCSGIPFISTPVGYAEILAKRGAGLIAKTPEEMRINILCLIENEDLRKEMGKKGMIIAREFDWKIIYQKYMTVYENALRH